MREYLKCSVQIVFGFALICVVFLAVRSVDLFFFKIYNTVACNIVRADYIAGFNGYRDYVTILTGLLTLIIGATGIGAFLSFKKFRAEQQQILNSLKKEKKDIANRKNQLDMFLKIEEARNNLEYEWGFLSAIKLYDEAEEKYASHYLLYTLRGNAYYFAAKRSIGLSEGRESLYLDKAKSDFESAIDKNKNSMLALYGLGQVLFQQALISRVKKNSSDINWENLPSPGKKDLSNEDLNKLKTLHLKEDGDYSGANAYLVKESIQRTQDAIDKGYDDVAGDYTLAAMYEAIDNTEMAYTHYKNAYGKGHLQSGYQYCYLWLRKNPLGNSDQSEEIKNVVSILNRVSTGDNNSSNAAYSLLMFIYSNTDDLENINYVYHRIDKLTIDNLFEQE